ncbi:MAG TPA: hypothetical protein VGS07_00145 [Thermoanaerobaculia bacterium]|jgi:hypothetical protein|nr:hypothetical protein [Thermoanaerobaculia bacterium]
MAVWNPLRSHAAEVVRYADAVGIAKLAARLMNELEQHLKAKGFIMTINATGGGGLRGESGAGPSEIEERAWQFGKAPGSD